MLTPLGDALRDKMWTNTTLKRQVETAGVVEIAKTIFQDFLGSDIAKQAKPLFLKNRTLTVSCGSSSIAQEIRLNQMALVDKINDKLGKKEVDRIRYLA